MNGEGGGGATKAVRLSQKLIHTMVFLRECFCQILGQHLSTILNIYFLSDDFLLPKV